MNVTFQVEGFKELFSEMDQLAEEIGKTKTDRIWKNALLYAFEPVFQDAKTFAPKDTYDLFNHIYVKAHRPQARDKASTTYQGESYMVRVSVSPIRDDSIQKFILTKKGKVRAYWTNTRPVAVSQEFGNAHNAAHPFLRPAIENNYDKVVSRLGWAITNALDKIDATKGS